MPYCTACGAEVSDTDQYCADCGASLPGGHSQKNQGRQPNRRGPGQSSQREPENQSNRRGPGQSSQREPENQPERRDPAETQQSGSSQLSRRMWMYISLARSLLALVSVPVVFGLAGVFAGYQVHNRGRARAGIVLMIVAGFALIAGTVVGVHMFRL